MDQQYLKHRKLNTSVICKLPNQNCLKQQLSSGEYKIYEEGGIQSEECRDRIQRWSEVYNIKYQIQYVEYIRTAYKIQNTDNRVFLRDRFIFIYFKNKAVDAAIADNAHNDSNDDSDGDNNNDNDNKGPLKIQENNEVVNSTKEDNEDKDAEEDLKMYMGNRCLEGTL